MGFAGKTEGVFSLEKRRLRRDLIVVFQHLMGSYKEDEGSLFTRSHMEKTRCNGYKLHQNRFRLNIRKTFFTLRPDTGTTFPEKG